MKKIRLFLIIMALIITAGGCGTRDITGSDRNNSNITDKDDTGSDTTGTEVTDGADTTLVQFQAEVIEVGDRLLITPDKDSNEYKSSDRISVGTVETVILGAEGRSIQLTDLQPGDLLQVTYNGMIAESYPAQINATELKVVGHNILIDGYLALIDDIYREDSGLNSDIDMIALDTTGWTEISGIEKEIIFMKMKKLYDVEIIEGTFDELAEQKIIDKDNLYFPDGIHIIISDMKYDQDKEKITCAIRKWRSGLGAIGADDVTAKYKNGKWEIKKEGMWIS